MSYSDSHSCTKVIVMSVFAYYCISICITVGTEITYFKQICHFLPNGKDVR